MLIILAFPLFLSACGSGDSNDSEIAEFVAISTATSISLDQPEFVTKAPPTIEIVQVTPTPLPTATPTPTATPVIYEIQQGDTLLGIAIQNFTTVEEIQALNPDVRPELLAIGQQIVLPPAATPVFAGEPPTQVPLNITVLDHALYPDGGGGLWVVGEIQNDSGFPVLDVTLIAKIFGEDGVQVAQFEIFPVKRQLGARETSPFGGLLPQKPNGVLQADVSPSGGISLNDPGGQLIRFEPVALDFEQSEQLLKVNGRVPVPAGTILTDYQVLLTAFDNEGRVTGFSTYPADQIELVDEGLTIEASLFLIGGDASRVLGELLRR